MLTLKCWPASAACKCGLQVTDSFGLQAGQVVRRWPDLRASVAVFKSKQV